MSFVRNWFKMLHTFRNNKATYICYLIMEVSFNTRVGWHLVVAGKKNYSRVEVIDISDVSFKYPVNCAGGHFYSLFQTPVDQV